VVMRFVREHIPVTPAGESGLLYRAAVRTRGRGTLQVRRRVPEPHQTVLVQVREDRGSGAAIPFVAWWLGPPRTADRGAKEPADSLRR
jgi:hypothetical protein